MSAIRPKKAKQNKQQQKPGRRKSQFGDDMLPDWALTVANHVYQVKRTIDSGTAAYVQAAGVNTYGSLYFTLDVLDGYTEFTNLFDLYRIDAIRVSFVPQANMMTMTTNATYAPVLYTVIDHDDATAPTSIGNLREYQTLRETRFDRDNVRTLRPKFAVASYSGAFTSYAEKGGWVNCSSPSVQWYGIKFAISAGAVGQTNLQAWTLKTEYYLSFKNVR